MDTYEKKYKNALTIAQSRFKIEKDESVLTCLGMMFPELRESEDEKIRKSIVATIEQCPDDFLNPKNRDKMLAYLEKQKEPKHAPDDLQKSFEAGQTSIVDNPEQYGLCKKTEWSEEDELMRKRCIVDLGQLTGYEPQYKVRFDEQIDWLKSLRPQPKKGLHPGSIRKIDNPMKWMEEDEKEREQKQVTWSEEDEKVYNNALDALYYKDCNDKDDVLSALKDLCDLISRKRKVIPPYARYRPSEEQKEALQRAIDCLDNEYGDHPEELDSLLNDLNKL